MRTLAVAFILLITAAACSEMTGPTTPSSQPEGTKSKPTVITLSEPKLVPVIPVTAVSPSCEWRDQQVALHMGLGGKAPDIVTLSNGHRVYIQDTGTAPGYRVYDYPTPWCTGEPLKTQQDSGCYFTWPCDEVDF